jgi:hypothetical protein
VRVSELTEARDVGSPWDVAVLEEVAGNSEAEPRRLWLLTKNQRGNADSAFAVK